MNDDGHKTILLVEDEAVVAMAETTTLEQFGYDVITASSGSEAIETAAEHPEIDLVLMDINLGDGMDGTEVAQHILKDHDLPLVFLSAHSEREVVTRTEGITSYGYVVKNSGDTVLIASVKMAFRLFDARKKERANEQALKESEERFRDLAEMLPEAVFETDTNMTLTYANRRAFELFGYSQADFDAGLNAFDMIMPEDRERAVDNVQRRLRGEELGSTEYVAQTKSGSPFDILLHLGGVLKNGSLVGFRGVLVDISERKQAENALRTSEDRLDLALYVANEGLWDWDLTTSGAYFDARYYTMAGYEPNEFPGTFDAWAERVHPDDYQSAEFGIKSYLAGEAATYDATFRFRRKDGEWMWIRARGKIVERDATGVPLRMVGTHADISDQKRTEEALRESEDQLGALYQTTSHGIVFHDGDGAIISANPAAGQILGLTVEQMIGRTSIDPRWRAIHEDGSEYPGDTHPAMISLKTGKPVQNAIMGIFHPEKEEYRWISVDTTPLFKDAVERPRQVYAVFKDITQYRAAEERVRRLLGEKEILLKEVHHRIKNNFATVGSLMSLHAQSTTSPEAISVLTDAIARVNSMRVLYDRILLADDYRVTSVKQYLNGLIDEIVPLFPGNSDVAIDRKIDDFRLDAKQLYPIGIITNELFTNAMKHAFVDRNGGRIRVALTRERNHVVLTVGDDGVGLSGEFDIAESGGFGLMLVSMLSQQLGGTATMSGKNGTTSVVEFDIDETPDSQT